MEKLILIKYGELTTKKDNRKFFIKELVTNIRKKIDNIEIEYSLDRMYIRSSDLDDVVTKLKEIFGIYSIIECYRVNANIDEIKETVLSLLKEQDFNTFKVITKRSDKSFPISSMDFSSQIGGFILKNISSKVDVHNPDLYVNIEIKNGYSYIYFNEIKGLGGYPVGVQGKGLLMLSGGIDSPVAGYMALKRGVDIECIYFDSPPHTSIEAKNKVIDLAHILNKYSGRIKINVIPFTKLQETIYKNVPNEYMITIMRRMMYRIPHKLALKNKCKVIINGESIGQVASQTLTSINTINSVTNFPVIRPVACLDKLEIIEISKKIGTYDISIKPYEDCCTVFVPKHPSINPDINKCLEFEKLFDYDSLIDDAINNNEVIYKLDRNKYQDLL
ncbi:MAG: tRNA 4-thiouridine(8) synthase ThiI [Firmicutes bacterium]|nr:tRNA 4-thiouridine(8) synthase ThiI [Bacillota bacterium]